MVKFKMVGLDVEACPRQHRTWIVDDNPDYDGYYYDGYKSGPTRLEDVATYLIDDYLVVDFNLPDPLKWESTKKTLPSQSGGSHLAVIDGYIYLFGGQNSDKIYKAHVSNPADFEDTGSTLPNKVGDGQLAIIKDQIYIFGGNDGYSDGYDDGYALNNIYSANISDPLNWIDNGSLLPKKIYSSQLAVFDNNIYLFGGHDGYNAINNIFYASTSNPLLWTELSETLPKPVFNSQVGVINGYVYLFGGQNIANEPISDIYRAPLNDMSGWYNYGFLPKETCSGQFFTLGDMCYIIAPAANDIDKPNLTKIFRAPISAPYVWVDIKKYVPYEVFKSQLAIIEDRIFLYGGSGSSVIIACNYSHKYNFYATPAVSYGDVTRTQYQSTPTFLDLFKVLGFAPWRTNYKY